jgi:hypothetical protein
MGIFAIYFFEPKDWSQHFYSTLHDKFPPSFNLVETTADFFHFRGKRKLANFPEKLYLLRKFSQKLSQFRITFC